VDNSIRALLQQLSMKKNILLLSLACVEVRKESNVFFYSYKK
jgi:hypothetical protein